MTSNVFDLSGKSAVITGGNGGIAVYLMSDASQYHTADCFVIDGGFAAA